MMHAVYPGSFDPVTLGHLDIIKRALSIFQHLTVAVLVNPNKTPLFSIDERRELISEALKDYSNVTVEKFDGLLVNYAEKIQADVILRGLRAVSDFEFEFQLSLMNQKLNPRIHTVHLMASADYTYLSSGVVKEVARLGGSIADFVPVCVARALKEKIKPI